MVEVKIRNFNLKQIADSGQVFRCDRFDELILDRYRFHYLNKSVVVEEIEIGTFRFSCTEEEFNEVWFNYFGLSDDISLFRKFIDADEEFLLEAYNFGSGIRILHQDVWEALVSFIISQNNNIPRIKKCIQKLCSLYGGFPSAEDMLDKPRFLSEVGLGYRDVYLLDASRKYNIEWGNGTYFKKNNLSCEEFINEVKKVHGVGDKVANCVALFGMHYLEACPIDVWMRRVIVEEYKGVMPEWMYKNKTAGYYQQLVFYYMRYY